MQNMVDRNQKQTDNVQHHPIIQHVPITLRQKEVMFLAALVSQSVSFVDITAVKKWNSTGLERSNMFLQTFELWIEIKC